MKYCQSNCGNIGQQDYQINKIVASGRQLVSERKREQGSGRGGRAGNSIELRINLGARAEAHSLSLSKIYTSSRVQATSAADFTSKLMGVQMHHSDGHHQSLPIKQSTKQTAAAAAAGSITTAPAAAATCCP